MEKHIEVEKHIKLSRFLSLVLRHNPGAIGISLDKNGWADVAELVKAMNRSGRNIDMVMLEEIVSSDNKKRYSFNVDKTKIRANQGHSIPVDIELEPKAPPEILYHGTAERFYRDIKNRGLHKQKRNHVHLSIDRETAESVGIRHGFPVILSINAGQMYREGYVFYLSENGVWLTDNVPSQYISVERR